APLDADTKLWLLQLRGFETLRGAKAIADPTRFLERLLNLMREQSTLVGLTQKRQRVEQLRAHGSIACLAADPAARATGEARRRLLDEARAGIQRFDHDAGNVLSTSEGFETLIGHVERNSGKLMIEIVDGTPESEEEAAKPVRDAILP